MKIITPYAPAVVLFTNDGNVRTFKSPEAALNALGIRWICANVGLHFCAFAGFEARFDGNTWKHVRKYHYSYAIMRNELGDALTVSDFYELRKSPSGNRFRRRYPFWNGAGPVPNTGKTPAGRHYFRHLHTMQERRLAQQIDPAEPAPRAARNLANLPQSWDDYSVAARSDISWKRHRRTQWKAK